MSRNPSAPQIAQAVLALLLVGFGVVVFRAAAPGTSAVEASESAFNISTPADTVGTVETTAADVAAGESQALALPAAVDGAGVLQLSRPAVEEPAPSTTAAPDPEPDPAPATSAAPAAATPAPAANNDGNGNNNQEKREEYDDPTKVDGYDVHAFPEHVVLALGSQMMAPGQATAGGYERIGPYEIRGQSTITAVRPVIEQGIADVLERSPNARGIELERKVAKRLTELNDWKNLNNGTREKMMILSGVDIQNLNKRVREDVVNHLLHSPLPFGDLAEVLTPDTTVDLGYTHTLDKDWTQTAHLGDGVFQIWMISNNNNGSHTGHIMGSFKVQLSPDTTQREARRIGNEMVKNKNKNNKLYLDEAARKILYGETPLLDFRNMTEEERRATYAGKGLGTYAGTNGPVPAPEPEPEPVDPAETPADPENPAEPPADPADPEDPETPADPENPETPADPDPETPADPEDPDASADPPVKEEESG